METTSMNIDQLIVRVGKACNFRCNFCNVSDNENHVRLKENVQDIVRNFHYKLQHSDISSGKILVTISGGEPSIFKKETIFALRYIRCVLQRQKIEPIFDIQTNASEITQDFVDILKQEGVYLAMVSFHTHIPNIFEDILGIRYEKFFDKIKQGMLLFHQNGIRVETNTVMNKQNWSTFTETLKYIDEYLPFVETLNIGFVQPHGEAEKNIDSLVEQYDIVAPEYNKGIEYIKGVGKTIVSHFVGLPVCYLNNPIYSTEAQTNIDFRKENRKRLNQKFLVNKLNDKYKTHTKKCLTCIYNNICSGIWTNFEGIQKLNPSQCLYIHQIPQHSTVGNLDVILTPGNLHNLDIIELYNLGKRVLYISGDYSKLQFTAMISQIQRAIGIGYYKIIRLYDGISLYEPELLHSGVGGVQIYINNISIDQILELLDFSKKYSPQFEVTLHLYIMDQLGISIFRKYFHFFRSTKVCFLIEKSLYHFIDEKYLTDINIESI